MVYKNYRGNTHGRGTGSSRSRYNSGNRGAGNNNEDDNLNIDTRNSTGDDYRGYGYGDTRRPRRPRKRQLLDAPVSEVAPNMTFRSKRIRNDFRSNRKEEVEGEEEERMGTRYRGSTSNETSGRGGGGGGTLRLGDHHIGANRSPRNGGGRYEGGDSNTSGDNDSKAYLSQHSTRLTPTRPIGTQRGPPRSRYEGSTRNSNFAHSVERKAQEPFDRKSFLSHLPKGPKSTTIVTAPSQTSRYNNDNSNADNINNNDSISTGNPTSSRYNDKDSRLSSSSNTRALRREIPSGPQSLSKAPLRQQQYKRRITCVTQKRDSSIYERILQVGEGTYGKVYKAKNLTTNKLVALKKLRLQNEKEGFPITSIREIKLLQNFNDMNVSTVKEIMVESSRTIYMIFDYFDNDLGGILLNKSITLRDSERKDIFQQLLQGCRYLHQHNVLHRDIKGSNILIDNNGLLRITDFGLARRISVDDKTETSAGLTGDYTNRVVTLWYRPPELLLGSTSYGTEVDMWGCGCLLVELFRGSAAFQGSNEIEQLVAIMKVLGTPTPENFPNLFEMPWFFMVMPLIKERYTDALESSFSGILPSAACFELIKGLLLYSQKDRWSAAKALQSKYFTEDPQPERLVLNGRDATNKGGYHEYEIKLARRRQKEKEKEKEKSTQPV